MRSTIDLIGMYNYDSTILDDFVVPEAVDRDTLINNLLMESAELELLYSDALFLKMAVGFWSKKQLHIWEAQYDTTQYEYNPIWNKDGEFIETRDLKLKEDTKDNLKRTDNLQDKNTRDTEDKTTYDSQDKETRDIKDETINSVYGFNSNDDAPANKDEAKGTGTDTMDHSGSDTTKRTGTDTVDHTGTQNMDRGIDSTKTDTGTVTRIERGNIGLTSTQQLITEQREVVQYNIYDIIISDFIDRFCLKIY